MRIILAFAFLAVALAGGVAFMGRGRPTPGPIACASRPAIAFMPERRCWREPATAIR
jgi:hypothetical protein